MCLRDLFKKEAVCSKAEHPVYLQHSSQTSIKCLMIHVKVPDVELKYLN